MKTYLLLGALLVIVLAPQVSATSFIEDCQYAEYRTNQSDYVFVGEVISVTEIHTDIDIGPDAFTEVVFAVHNTTKGNIDDTFTLTQPGHISGEAVIPAITLAWEQGTVYQIYAHSQIYESDQEINQLTCGVMGREEIKQEMCAQVITHAQNPQTGDVHEYSTPCDVPEGWEVVDEPQEVEPEPTPQPSIWQRMTSWLTSWF